MYELVKNQAYAFGKPEITGKIKVNPEDFCVDECLGFDPCGEGEHVFLQIEKKLLTTEEVVRIISKGLNLPSKLVSYAGLKDKFAKTTQWFSVHMPGKLTPDFEFLSTDNVKLLQKSRHNKKLKTGCLKANRFQIKIRSLYPNHTSLRERVEMIRLHGVPNYFGMQRFGNNGSNLNHSRLLLLENKKIKNKYLKGLYYSAARSFLFNQILAARVASGNWNQAIIGDVMMLAGSNSVFHIENVDTAIEKRVAMGDIYPAACLWGNGQERLTNDALTYQSQVLSQWAPWCDGLERHGLKKDYRAMVLFAKDICCESEVVSFTLPRGGYATTILRELLQLDE
jgi:tRNA pseudouridine13 synthase